MLTRAVGIFAWVMFALVLAGIVLARLKRGPKPELREGIRHLFPMPALVLEFAGRGRGVQDVITNLGQEGVGGKLQSELRFDSLFITFYLLLFTGIALVLGQSGGVWVWVAAAAVACSIGAAAADGVENLAMARAVERYAAGGAAGAPDINIATAGLLKWALSFAALGLLSLTFWGRGCGAADVGFWLTALVAALGAVGLVVVRARPNEFRPIQAAFLLTLLLVPVVALLFTAFGEYFDPPAA